MTEAKCPIAVVTGASRGLGQAIARSLSDNAHCILVDRDETVAATAAAIASPLGTAQAVVADVGDESAVRDLMDRVGAEHGRLDILVNNAGIHPRGADNHILTIEEISREDWETVLRVNLTSAFSMTKLALPIMRQRRWGRIINMSSRTARTFTGTASAAYVTSKAAIIALTRQIAGEEAKNGITANCLAPGSIRTPMSSIDGEAGLARRAKISPMGRIGEPEEIGAIVRFLVSQEAGYVSGITLDVNGGSYMA